MKDILAKLEYTVDPSAEAPTYVTVPLTDLFSDNAQLFQEESQTADLINGNPVEAAVDGNAAYPIRVRTPDPAYLAALKAAASAGTFIGLRETLAGGETVTTGPGTVTLALNRPGRGGIAMRLLTFAARGADNGDTYTVAAGS
ncbi:MAG TPA: hypothetical protein VF576_03450 [Rubricoccaceae bacterium]|jgi:hypothetical protein